MTDFAVPRKRVQERGLVLAWELGPEERRKPERVPEQPSGRRRGLIPERTREGGSKQTLPVTGPVRA